MSSLGSSSPRARALVSCLALAAVGALVGIAGSTSPAAAAHHSHGFSVGYSSTSGGPEFQYALISGNGNTFVEVADNGAWSHIGTIQKEVESTGHEAMWFALEGQEYAIRDSRLMDRARAIVAPMNELGKEQGRLGSKQGELGRKQGELGRIQGRIGSLEGRLASLQASRDMGSRDAGSPDELASLRKELEELHADARDLGERQRELGEQQRVLGEQQRVLGERQGIASRKADAELRQLASDAIDSGKAERLGD